MTLKHAATIELRTHVHAQLSEIIQTQCERDNASALAYHLVEGVCAARLEFMKRRVDEGFLDKCVTLEDVYQAMLL